MCGGTKGIVYISSSGLEELKLWNLRHGHVPFDMMKCVVFKDKNLDSLIHKNICSICPATEHCKRSFTNSEIWTKKYFELMHVDVWSPYKCSTYNGCVFF